MASAICFKNMDENGLWLIGERGLMLFIKNEEVTPILDKLNELIFMGVLVYEISGYKITGLRGLKRQIHNVHFGHVL